MDLSFYDILLYGRIKINSIKIIKLNPIIINYEFFIRLKRIVVKLK
jgi:hypothetical protein